LESGVRLDYLAAIEQRRTPMIRSLQHVALTVPNLEVGRAFYTTFGLEARPLGSGLAFRCTGRAMDQIRLEEGPKKKLAHVAFGTAAAELPLLKQRLQSGGFALLDAPVREDGDGIWFRDPDGDLINVRVAQAAPVQRPGLPVNNPGEYRRAGTRGVGVTSDAPVQPRRLGHLIKFTTDVERAIGFYTTVLGMKLSDRVQDKIAFLRCGNDGDHHALGVALADGPGLHHVSFEVSSVDEIVRGAQALIGAGYRDAFGLGRHVMGSNYFHYIRDPWMSLVEYFWDIDFIPEGSEWTPANGALGPRAVYQWATVPMPPDFVKNYELA
jgi:catechol 2,3-dioxygenase-like lactoylglutathione lyase family enzyme